MRWKALQSLESDTLYYADEGSGKQSHPWTDMWIRSKRTKGRGSVLLVEIYGGTNSQAASTKLERLSKMCDHLCKQDTRKWHYSGLVFEPEAGSSRKDEQRRRLVAW